MQSMSGKVKRLFIAALVGALTIFLLASYFHKTIDQGVFTPNPSTKEVPSINRLFVPRDFDSYKPSSRINHIGFLKVHKAGSTTMQNMFFRYAIRHNLTLVLPNQGNYLFSKAKMLPVRPPNHHDIFAIHTVYSKGFFDSMLQEDSVFIAIIREPLERMISAAFYYRDVWGFYRGVPKTSYIHSLINDADKYDRGPFSYTRNSMGKDFGFASSTKIGDKADIASRLNSLEKEFKLVLLVEKFHESLILMKQTLNWDLRDIIYVSTNSYKHEETNLTENEISKFKEINFLDYAIYDHFSKITMDKINSQGPDFFDEVRNLDHTVGLVGSYCRSNTQTDLVIQESRWTNTFSVSRTDCNFILMKEPNFIAHLRRRHSSKS